MLRYYDETGLLKPAQIDKFTGYRIYSVEQIPILHRIIFLRDSGFNVSEISVAISNWDNEAITAQLKEKQREIEASIMLEKEKLTKIAVAINDIREGNISTHCNVSLKSVPSYQVLSLREVIPNYFCEGALWKKLYDYMNSNNIHLSQPDNSFAIYHDEEYKENGVDVEVCVAVDEMGISKNGFTYRETEKVDIMACAMVYGPYENITGAYKDFAFWLAHHNQYKMLGQNRQICHRGPWNEKEADKYLTEIQIPVVKQ